jgi:hypothetical protein
VKTFVFGRAKWWQWLTVLSLDAPAVALLWQWELARAAGVALAAPRPFVLGASIWLAYVADRWIEGWRLEPDRIRTQRHRFYQRWRWPVAVLWAAVFGADLASALTGLAPRDLRAGWIFLAPVLAYLLSHQLVHRHRRWRAPKEICVALLLGGGAALFVAASPEVHLRLLAVPLAWFVALCLANCALISVWEDAVDQSHGQTSLARQFRRGAAFSRVLPWLLAGGAALAWLEGGAAQRSAAACAAASAFLLALVDRLQPRFGREMARILADIALMTPAVPLIVSLSR